jgi:hypothetical protein
MYAASRDHCMLAGCDRPIESCGLCDPCYQLALKLIRLGKTTREELEQRGLILPPRHRQPSSPLTLALIESRAADAKETDEKTSKPKVKREAAVKVPAKSSRRK